MFRAALTFAVLACGGCNLQRLTPTSEVIRTRVAGVAAEPAEIAPGESTELSALLVHAPGEPPALGALWFACVAASDATGCLGVDLQSVLEGEGPAPDPAAGGFQFGVGETFRYEAIGPAFDEAWAALPLEDRAEGLTVFVSVNFVARTNDELLANMIALGTAWQSGDEEAAAAIGEELAGLMGDAVSAARRVVVSDKTAATPDPVDCPVGTLLPNSNPGFAGLLLHRAEDGKDGGYPLGDITFAAPGSTLMLRPALVSGAREDYLYVNSDGDTECRQELPFFAWMTNGGTFDGDYTFVAEEGDLDEIAGREKVNHLTLPDRESMADGVDLWVVARDRRGGLTWLKRRFLPQDE